MSEAVHQLSGVQPTSAVELATIEIRRSILVGGLAPGSSFSVAELARQLGISHIPVREALRQLETEGLIVLNRGRSAAVAPLTVNDVRGIYGLRLLIEPELAARSAELHTPAQVDELRRLLTEIRSASPQDALRAERDFHMALARPAGSEWDLRTMQQLQAAALRYNWLIFDPAQIADRERHQCGRIHGDILDAVLAHDLPAVRERMREHLQENESYLVKRIEAM
jgi:DNA-binding GntR family transcriptional regulator